MTEQSKIKTVILIIVAFYVFAAVLPKLINILVPIIFIGLIYFKFAGSNGILRNTKLNDKIKNIKNKSMDQVYEVKQKSKIALGTILAIVLIFVFLTRMIIVIPAGFTGVYYLFGKVNDNELSSGIHVINPFAKVQKMDIRTQDYTMSVIQGEGRRIGSDTITAITKEGLTVGLDITVLFKLIESEAAFIYKTVGVQYDEIIIRPSIRSDIREVIATYEAKDIYSEKRKEAATKIEESLKENLKGRGVLIEQVMLRDILLPEKLSASIQEKLSAEQEAQKYEFILQKEEKEAERKIIEATAQRDAQKIINESLTPRYLQYLYIRELQNREGTIYVPISPDNGMPMFKGIN